MTHTITRTEVDEWEEEICDECGHPVAIHYDEPEEVMLKGQYIYTATGCMVMLWPSDPKGRWLPGANPYPRCPCMKAR